MEDEKEKRLELIAPSYYARKDIQNAIFEFCKNRETIARNFDSFSKRPDSLEYPSDIINLVKKGFSSFHCSEELWHNPLSISTSLSPEEFNSLRIGWDLLIDIDCKWFDYSKRAGLAIVKTLEHHGVKNMGIKFSGGKGLHIIIPWKAFPKELNGMETKNLFHELPRKVVSYIRFYAEKILKESLPDDFYEQFKNVEIKRGIKCKACNEIASSYELVSYGCKKCRRRESKKILDTKKEFKCPDCRIPLEILDSRQIFECKKCNDNSEKSPDNFSKSIEADLFELMGLDVVLVSPRHLFRAPYSLHEKGLVSCVIDREDLEKFEPKDASPLKIIPKNFYPNAHENEAKELVITALDWHEHKEKKEKKQVSDMPEIKLDHSRLQHPPCIELILKGMADGNKRAVFILINYFRSLGLDFQEIEKKLEEWNKKNTLPLKEGYIKSQISWAERNKKMLPPNCDKDYYKAIGVCNPDNLCRKIKNPVNYAIRKHLISRK